MNSLVSFIIVTYERNDEVIEAINSILSQTGKFEIIVIDNNPASTLKDVIPVDSRIRHLLQNENKGYVWARNFAPSVARGDILVYLDDDAVLASDNVIETVFRKIDKAPNIAIIGDPNKTDPRKWSLLGDDRAKYAKIVKECVNLVKYKEESYIPSKKDIMPLKKWLKLIEKVTKMIN